MTFSEQLKQTRKDAGWTQNQLAQELNVSRTTISRWESGTIMPDLETIKLLSKTLNVNFFTTDEFSDQPPQEDESTDAAEASAEKRRSVKKPLAVLAAVLMLAAAFILPWAFRKPKPAQTPPACPLAIFKVNDPVIPAVEEPLGSDPRFTYRFSIQNTSPDVSFTMNKIILKYEYPNGSTAFHVEYDQSTIPSIFGAYVFTPGYGSLLTGSEALSPGYSGVTITIEGIDSLNNPHSISSHITFQYPTE